MLQRQNQVFADFWVTVASGFRLIQNWRCDRHRNQLHKQANGDNGKAQRACEETYSKKKEVRVSPWLTDKTQKPEDASVQCIHPLGRVVIVFRKHESDPEPEHSTETQTCSSSQIERSLNLRIGVVGVRLSSRPTFLRARIVAHKIFVSQPGRSPECFCWASRNSWIVVVLVSVNFVAASISRSMFSWLASSMASLIFS